MNEFLKLVYEPRPTDNAAQLRQNAHNIQTLLFLNVPNEERQQLREYSRYTETLLKALEN